MPIYEYQCEDCGKTFAHLHKRLNEPKPPCPDCGSGDVRKLLSTFSATSGSACAHEDTCPHAATSGHSCCGGCCHHHH